MQGFSNSVLEGRCPAEFSSNPDQTHLSKLIKVFRITRNFQEVCLIRVGAKLCRTAADQNDQFGHQNENIFSCLKIVQM